MKSESNNHSPRRTRREFLGRSLAVAAAASATVLPVRSPAQATLSRSTPAPLDIGTRLELFVDRALIADLRGVELRLHEPVRLRFVLKECDLYSFRFSET